MGIWIDIARVSTALNVVLLLGLSYVWLDNYRQFRSKHTLGLSVFAILLLCQNALAVYIYSWDETCCHVWFATESSGPPRGARCSRSTSSSSSRWCFSRGSRGTDVSSVSPHFLSEYMTIYRPFSHSIARGMAIRNELS